MDMRHRLLGLVALTASAFASAALAQVASFDCTKAETDTEWAICNTPGLGKLDVQMAAYYSLVEAVARGSGFAGQMKSQQAGWVHGTRDACGGDVGCLAKAYRARISAIEAAAKTSLTVK